MDSKSKKAITNFLGTDQETTDIVEDIKKYENCEVCLTTTENKYSNRVHNECMRNVGKWLRIRFSKIFTLMYKRSDEFNTLNGVNIFFSFDQHNSVLYYANKQGNDWNYKAWNWISNGIGKDWDISLDEYSLSFEKVLQEINTISQTIEEFSLHIEFHFKNRISNDLRFLMITQGWETGANPRYISFNIKQNQPSYEIQKRKEELKFLREKLQKLESDEFSDEQEKIETEALIQHFVTQINKLKQE